MRVDEFDFELPPERIALRPVEPRDRARLLVVHADPFRMTDNLVYDLPSLLSSGDVLVVNDTKVIPARLFGHRRRGEAVAKIDVTLHKRETLNQWRCFIKPAKKLDLNEVIQFEAKDNERHTLSARLIEKGEGGEVLLEFSCQGTALDAAILEIGHMPLPPYIAAKRAEDQKDARDYQTIFAEQSGAVAAPTAGLHFTPDLLDALQKKGIEIIRITLHVGAGTFLPVKVEDTKDHRMHAEWGSLSAAAANALNHARQKGKRIIAVGTTSLRLLESAVESSGHFVPWSGDTSIFITPGFSFRAVDVLMTNFHLPRSTLLMLVSAFSGLQPIKTAYRHAIDQGYRFYSYGDASLLFRAQKDPVP